MKMKKITIVLIVLLISFSTYSQQTSIVSNKAQFETALNNNSVSIIEVNSNIDFQNKAYAINRNLLIRGSIQPAAPAGQVGAYSITQLKKLANVRFLLGNNNISFRFLSITGYPTNSNFESLIRKSIGGPAGGTFTFFNVRLKLVGEKIGFHGGQGFGGSFNFVTLFGYDGNGKGIIMDRLGAVNSTQKVIFKSCKFISGPNVQFSTRAISLDAGNKEYPVIWNHSGTTIDNCTMVNGGFAGSKVKNIIIKNNRFIFTKSNNYLVDEEDNINFAASTNVMNSEAIHIEEFSSDITVGANTYDFQTAAKGIVFDKEHQPVNNVNITNAGTWLGGANIPNPKAFGWRPQNTNIPTNITQDLNREESTYRKEYWANGDTSNNADAKKWDNAAKFRTNGTFETSTADLGIPEGNLTTQWIRIKKGNQYLQAPTNGSLGATALTTGTGWWAQWKLVKVPNKPINFVLINRMNPQYALYAPDIYTESNFRSNSFPVITNVIGFDSSGDIKDKPSWVIRKVGSQITNEAAKWYLHPGGNERKTRLGTSGLDVRIKAAQECTGANCFIAYKHNTADLWELIATGSNSSKSIDKEKETTTNSPNIQVYTNNNSININLNSTKSQNASIEIFNMLGQKQFNDSNISINVGENNINYNALHLSKGVYVIKVNTLSGEKYFNKILLK